jgi:phage/plasmid-like protein (TIGR03299 family)
MAHEVESMLYQGDTPWHNIGDKITPEQSRDVNFILAHPSLNWTCEKRSLFMADGREVETKAVVRSTDGAVLGEVGKDYTIVQNATAIEWFRPFIESGSASVECVGSLRGGSRVFVLAKLAHDPVAIVPGDEVLPYLLLANAHDGTLRLHVGFSPIRVVCANTLRMARTDKRSKLLQLKHTTGVTLALATVQATIDVVNRQFLATIEQYKRLAEVGCTEETLKKYVSLVFQAPTVSDDAPIVAPEEETKSRVYGRIHDLFEGGKGTSIPGVRGTLWGAVNAVSEFVQYQRGSDDARRLNETWLGTGAALVQRATDIAIQMAA